MNRKTRGKLLMFLGFLLVFAATSIYSVYDYQDKVAGKNAQTLLQAFKQEQQTYDPIVNEINSDEIPQASLAGYNLIGTIKIPSVGLELPILHDWSYELLKIAPCRYSGSAGTRDLIILGHNYKTHFTPIKNVTPGSTVEFCDVNGTLCRYTVKKIEKLHKTALDRLTSADYDLTLFTCTTGGESRLVLRCVLIENDE